MASCCEPGGCLRRNWFLIYTLAGVLFGLIMGFSLRTVHMDKDTITLIGFPGELLMNMFKMIVIPLVCLSLIVGFGSMDGKTMGRIGGWALAYFACTTFLSVIVGIILAVTIHPGDPASKIGASTGANSNIENNKHVKLTDTLMDVMRNAFTDNLFGSTMQMARTKYSVSEKLINKTDENGTNYMDTKEVVQKSVVKVDATNTLGLVVFAALFGCVLGQLPIDDKLPLYSVIKVMNSVICVITKLIIWYSPIGVSFIVAEKLLSIDDLGAVVRMLGIFVASDLGGNLLVFGLQNLLFFLFTLQNPMIILGKFGETGAMALGTGSSMGCLPFNIVAAEKAGITKSSALTILPVGAAINLNGTAFHIAISCIFIAQVNGYSLSFGELCIVCLTSTLASVGVAGVPSGSLFTMIAVLSAINQPIQDISIIISVDWLLDRVRTAVNVYGDIICAGILDYRIGPPEDTMSVHTAVCAEPDPSASAEGGKVSEEERKSPGPIQLSQSKDQSPVASPAVSPNLTVAPTVSTTPPTTPTQNMV